MFRTRVVNPKWIGRIQEHGYDLCLVLEATLATREEEEAAVPSGAWSDEDARVLQDFRIALD